MVCGSATFFACLLCGCASTGLLKFGKEDFPKAGPKNPVKHVMAIWQPATGVGLEGRTCRGFAGQVFFITNDSPTPALIDGDVTIRLFDDQGSPEEQAKPIHQFQFDPDSWKSHARLGQLGLTYAVFIPYTRKGTHEASCSMMVSYTPRGGGPTLNSELVNADLPGTKSKTEPADDAPASDSIDETVAVRGRDLLEKAVETRQPRGTAARGETRSEARQAAVGEVALREMERLQAPRKLTSADEQRLIREAQARLSEENATHGNTRETQSTMRLKQQLRANPLDDDDREDRAEREDRSTRPAKLAPGRTGRRNPLLDSESDEDADDYWSAGRRSSESNPRIRKPVRLSGTMSNRDESDI